MTPAEPDDPRVVAAAGGDAAALEALLREHGPRVEAGLTIDPRWARVLEPADVMQVTYLEAFLRVRGLRTRTSAGFLSWLAACAANNLRDAVRELSREKRPDAHRRATRAGDSAQTLLAGLTAGAPTAGSVVAGREAVERLTAAVEALPASYARVVRALDLEERGVAEVAAELGRSPGAVHMLRSRAHDRLRELLRDSSPESA
jgi:RNA polymerase sigma-70 factor (ECF subfamily)